MVLSKMTEDMNVEMERVSIIIVKIIVLYTKKKISKPKLIFGKREVKFLYFLVNQDLEYTILKPLEQMTNIHIGVCEHRILEQLLYIYHYRSLRN